MNDLEALQTAARLEAMGIAVRSPSLLEKQQTMIEFRERGGNRAMRRATKRAQRRKGR